MRTGKRRLLAVMLAVLLLALCLSPSIARAAHRDHGCPGAENCAVCRMLEAGSQSLRLLCCMLAVCCALAAPRAQARPRERGNACLARANTPVLQKVRLND